MNGCAHKLSLAVFDWIVSILIIGGVSIFNTACTGNKSASPDKNESIDTNSVDEGKDEVSQITTVVKQWNKTLNNRDEKGLRNVYADEVFLYTSVVDGDEAVKLKIDRILDDPSWLQSIITDIETEFLSETSAMVSFSKQSKSSKGTHTYPAYMVLEKINGEWKIVKESDKLTDKNLTKKKSEIPDDAIRGDFDGDGQIDYLWTSAKYDSEGFAIGNITLKSDNPNINGLTWNGGMGVLLFNLGDLNDSGRDFLGCIPYSVSNWCMYEIYGINSGKWKKVITPFTVYLGNEDTDRVKKANKKGYIEIKTEEMGLAETDMDSMFEPKFKIVKLNW